MGKLNNRSLTLRLPVGLLRAVNKQAQKENISPSHIFRQGVRLYLKGKK